MFTGLVQALGVIETWLPSHGQLSIQSESFPWYEIKLGDSLAVNGVCLTVTSLSEHGFSAFVSPETLRRTTFQIIQPDQRVNLEKCLTLQSLIGGHLVTGHIDGVAQLQEKSLEGDSWMYQFSIPEHLMPFLAEKGSVCLHGVSLTVVNIDEDKLTVMLVPHTLNETTLGQLQEKELVNIEVDLLARYSQRFLDYHGASKCLQEAKT